MSTYSIRELEHLSGIKAPTIRIWEKRYGVVKPKRTSTNIRYYDDKDLKKLINLAVLNRQGHRISKLADLKDEELRKKALEYCFDPGNEEEADHYHLLTQAMLNIDEREFERIVDRLEKELGFEECMFQYMLPFLKNVGVLWHTGSINPAQEHFVSHLIRRKLMSRIEGCEQAEEDAPTYLMFLPEGEHHDIGLLFAYYLARKEGYGVCYLGGSVPDQDLKKIGRQYHYPYILTAFIDPILKADMGKRIDDYLAFFPRSRLILTGPQVEEAPHVENDRLHVIKSVEAFRDRLKDRPLEGKIASPAK